jgi:hypothetical protein
MGRPRTHSEDRPATPAERKAAQRARDKAEWVEVPRAAHEAHSARLDALQLAISAAAKQGDSAAQACRAGSIDTMLEKLTSWFEAQAQSPPE